jgi:phospholipid/cholesterol/gamma-HCH transport system ATP-binding protein
MSLKIKGLRKSFGAREILRGLDLELKDGEIVFVLGRSGTGKSVLLKNIVGLMKPDGGEIWLDGQEISKFSEEEYFPVRKKCGMVFQHPALFDSLTIYENVAFGLRRLNLEEEMIREKVRLSLSHVNLKDVEKLLPAEVSYGMQKRASLARTIALDPRYLLFDEPTTGLDPITTNAINNLILRLSRNLKTTSIVVSHDMHCALAIADQIIVLDQGLIVARGSPSELKNSEHPLVRDFLSEASEKVS